MEAFKKWDLCCAALLPHSHTEQLSTSSTARRYHRGRPLLRGAMAGVPAVKLHWAVSWSEARVVVNGCFSYLNFTLRHKRFLFKSGLSVRLKGGTWCGEWCDGWVRLQKPAKAYITQPTCPLGYLELTEASITQILQRGHTRTYTWMADKRVHTHTKQHTAKQFTSTANHSATRKHQQHQGRVGMQIQPSPAQLLYLHVEITPFSLPTSE